MAEDTSVKQAPEVEQAAAAAPAAKRGKKGKRIVQAGEVHIQATFNNTIVSVTDKKGEILTASSAGANGFRGSKKGTAYAAHIAAEKVAEIAKRDHGMKTVDVFVKGPGSGREAAIRALAASGLTVTSITDVTPVPHNGCRPPKRRRV